MEANDKKVLSKDEQAFYEMLGRAAALPLQMADKYGCIVVACPKGVHVSCVGAPEEILKSDEVPFVFKVFMGLAAVCDKLTGDERRAIFDVIQGATGRIVGELQDAVKAAAAADAAGTDGTTGTTGTDKPAGEEVSNG